MDQKPPFDQNSHRYKFFNPVKNVLPFFIFRTWGSNSDISLVYCPNDLKFWQMIGLTSGLIWYFIKKVGFLLKKRSFCRFTKKRRVKVKWGSNGDTSVVSWTKWPQIENIPNIRTGDDTQRKWTVFSTHKSHQKSTVTSKGCPSTYVVVSECFW